jgi:AcrR family transcriptional regulator
MKVPEEKILEVAYALFKEKGVRAVRMQDVAKNCGITLWDINTKFKSKKELILNVIRYILTKKSTYLVVNSSVSPSAVTELSNFFKFISENLDELGSNIFLEFGRHDPLALDQLKELVELTLMPYMHKVIERGITEGFCRSDLDLDRYAPIYFYILRSIIESHSDNWIEAKHMVNHINDIFLHGALNAKGMRL